MAVYSKVLVHWLLYQRASLLFVARHINAPCAFFLQPLYLYTTYSTGGRRFQYTFIFVLKIEYNTPSLRIPLFMEVHVQKQMLIHTLWIQVLLECFFISTTTARGREKGEDEVPSPASPVQGCFRQRDSLSQERAHASATPPDDRAVLPAVHHEGQGPHQLLLPAQGSVPQHLGGEVWEQLQGASAPRLLIFGWGRRIGEDKGGEGREGKRGGGDIDISSVAFSGLFLWGQ